MPQRHFYTDERNAQIVIALLKAHGIKRVIVSPGTSNMAFVGSIQYDDWFEIYSAIDERHAAYMACGLAAASGEPVVLSCTGATASRNYLPGLTEAYYRKLPILALTSAHWSSHAGNMYSQFVDRSVVPVDAVKHSMVCPPVLTKSQAHDCELSVNKALLELFRNGGGPVHVNLEMSYASGFNTPVLPAVRKITRYFHYEKTLPPIQKNSKIAIFVGWHKPFSKAEMEALTGFVQSHDAVVLCDLTSHYAGPNKIVPSLVCAQGIKNNPKYSGLRPDLILHIGELANDYPTYYDYLPGIAPSWRISVDGELRDRFGRLENVFEMTEEEFFRRYSEDVSGGTRYYESWKNADDEIRKAMPELPFSNLWISSQVVPLLSSKDVLHLGMSSTFQSWAAFLQDCPAEVCANVGVCGIDGCMSTLIGSSLCAPEKRHMIVLGDLAFFYDLNALGNRHVGKNIRILLINNGCGGLFHTPKHNLEQFTDILDDYMAAGGHFGCKSKELVRHYAKDLGYKYLTASSKEEFLANVKEFCADESDRPILFECFIDVADDRTAWGVRTSIDRYIPPHTIKGEVKKLVPQSVKNVIKGFMR